ncbi:deleted in azoospermia-like-A [Teleopsis dalmanni]|uniref:deleted in azoospermia-like-A n=1 Tax=Teleopsis dalmanni TaxID=139649 RepID=UPI0018CE3A41|nr:deleted in azoospermia-like-A [Teleopsis dalmanni]
MMNPLYTTRLYTPMPCGFRQHRGQHHYSVIVPNRIYVGDLKDDIGCSELIQIFSAHGRIKTVNLVTNAEGFSKGYGFVTFENADDAKKVQAFKKIVLIGNRTLTIASAFRKCQYCQSHISQSTSAVEHARSGAQSVAQTRSTVNSIDLYNIPFVSYTGKGGNAGQLDSDAYPSALPTAGEFGMFDLPTSASDPMFPTSAATRLYPINLRYSQNPVENMSAVVQVEPPVLSNRYVMTGVIRGYGHESHYIVLQAV